MSIARVAELAALLQGTGITSLTLTTPEETITLRREAGGIAAPAPPAGLVPVPPAGLVPVPPAGLVVAAPCSGVFRHAHPLRDEPLVRPGQPVQAGAVLGLLQVGPLLLHVTAPRPGVVAAVVTPEDTVVGYGTPLVRLEEA